jgi:phage-related protein (TIGR01555 family)
MLKPSYMFGGLSLSQLVKPYVDLWLNTRQNIGNLIQAFSVMVLKTNLSATLETGGGEMFERAELFNQGRDNAGLMMVDMKTEDFENVAVPLGGLDHLQAQAQEHMMSVVRIPAVKFTGIQPSGLNASSEGEIRTFYDTIGAYQESLFRPNLTKVMHFVMLSLWGEIDEDITFDFAPLWALTEKEEAEVRKMEAETDDILVNGVAALRPEEVRERIASDPDTPYSGLDVEDVPDPPQLQEQGLATGGKVNIKGTQGFGGGPGGKPPGNGE